MPPDPEALALNHPGRQPHEGAKAEEGGQSVRGEGDWELP